MPVGVLERLRRLARDPDGVVDRELPLTAEPVAERFALHERHREPEPRAAGHRGLAGVEHRQDVGMLEPRDELDLALEPLRAQGIGQLRMEHFERDRPVVAQVPGEVDRGHAPAAELPLDPVSIRQAGLEILVQVCLSNTLFWDEMNP